MALSFRGQLRVGLLEEECPAEEKALQWGCR
jgi:hypothetical protein